MRATILIIISLIISAKTISQTNTEKPVKPTTVSIKDLPKYVEHNDSLPHNDSLKKMMPPPIKIAPKKKWAKKRPTNDDARPQPKLLNPKLKQK
jgi:hypothetical protein